MRRLVSGLIGIYQYFISPIYPQSCRFTPSCSSYTKEAVLKYGVVKGSFLGLKRILRCNPWNPGGYDPLP